MRLDHRLIVLCLPLFSACSGEPPPLQGTLEWDRIAIAADASEPILRWAVAEGDHVEAGTILLELDARRIDARIERSRAELAQAEARLAELAYGARIETIDAARADVTRARAALAEAEREYIRTAELKDRRLIAAAALDAATAARDQRRAEAAAAAARLRELTHGTRPEQIEQAAAAVDAARAAVHALELDRERLMVTAPRAGRVDALPFKPGDQPPLGAVVASLLVGDAPYARVFVPAPKRIGLDPGTTFRVSVPGTDRPIEAILRSIRSEPSFTPYYALAGDDADRLVYRAELVLHGEGVDRLPAGLPVTAQIGRDDRE